MSFVTVFHVLYLDKNLIHLTKTFDPTNFQLSNFVIHFFELLFHICFYEMWYFFPLSSLYLLQCIFVSKFYTTCVSILACTTSVGIFFSIFPYPHIYQGFCISTSDTSTLKNHTLRFHGDDHIVSARHPALVCTNDWCKSTCTFMAVKKLFNYSILAATRLHVDVNTMN